MPIRATLTVIDFVVPGTYGVRSIVSGFDTVENDWTGADRYLVQLWPVEHMPPVSYLRRPAG
jgi:hypothetical protein